MGKSLTSNISFTNKWKALEDLSSKASIVRPRFPLVCFYFAKATARVDSRRKIFLEDLRRTTEAFISRGDDETLSLFENVAQVSEQYLIELYDGVHTGGAKLYKFIRPEVCNSIEEDAAHTRRKLDSTE